MTKMHTSGGEKWAGVHYCFLVLPSFHTLCTDASISITLGARVDHAAGALYGASGSGWMEQANFFFIRVCENPIFCCEFVLAQLYDPLCTLCII